MTDTAIVASAAAFVAAVAASIAFGQWRTARWKLAADLHQTRYAAYKTLLDAFEGWYRQGPMTLERHETLIKALASARYLFGPEVRDRLDLAIVQTHRLLDRESRSDVNDNQFVRDHISELHQRLFHLYASEDLFLPYLRLEPKNPCAWTLFKRPAPRIE